MERRGWRGKGHLGSGRPNLNISQELFTTLPCHRPVVDFEQKWETKTFRLKFEESDSWWDPYSLVTMVQQVLREERVERGEEKAEEDWREGDGEELEGPEDLQ
jgi:hypothetical protein